MSTDASYCFLDSNVFLHFQSFDQIDWPRELGRSSVVLVICQQVMRELEDKKRESDDRKIRERAKDALSRLRTHNRTPGKRALPNAVDLRVDPFEPQIEWNSRNLDPKVPDDRILASALVARDAGKDVVVLTDDYPMQEKASALGLECHVPGEHLRLPDTKTRAEQETERKLRRLEELERSIPRLALAFSTPEGPREFIEVVVPEPSGLTAGDIERAIDDERRRLLQGVTPSSAESEGRQPPHVPIPGSVLRTIVLRGPGEREVQKYVEQVEAYLHGAYCEYVQEKHEHEHGRARTVEVRLLLLNDGAATADDIEVLAFFPEWLKVATKWDMEVEPVRPEPPRKPSSPFGSLASLLLKPAVSQIIGPPGARLRVRGPSIETRAGDVEVWYAVERLKQGTQLLLPPVHVRFPSGQSSTGFSVRYDLVTPSVPGRTVGQLQLRVCRRELQESVPDSVEP